MTIDPRPDPPSVFSDEELAGSNTYRTTAAGTVLPAAAPEGASAAFDPNQPQPVIIDPILPASEGGGLEVDVAQLRDAGQLVTAAIERSDGDVSSVWHFLADKQKEAGSGHVAVPTQIKTATRQQMSSTPASGTSGERVLLDLLTQSGVEKPPTAASSRQPSGPAESSAGSNQDKLVEATELLRQLVSVASAARPSPPAQAEAPPQPVEETPSWLATIGLDFLKAEPERPSERVFFDLGEGGQHLCRFHRVVITQDVVVLVYDDRYDGDRFHPPSTPPGKSISVTFPGRENATYRVLVPPAPRLSFALGRLDFLVMVIARDEPPKPSREEQSIPVSDPAAASQEEFSALREGNGLFLGGVDWRKLAAK